MGYRSLDDLISHHILFIAYFRRTLVLNITFYLNKLQIIQIQIFTIYFYVPMCITFYYYTYFFNDYMYKVPFPQKRNTLDYAFFKKYNYWISTIHGQFSLKFF